MNVTGGGAISHHHFVIKMNRRVGTFFCGPCGKPLDPEVGPELFTSPAGEYVCLDCGRAKAPELAALLAVARAAENYIAEIFESADRPDPEEPE
jgi:hypothetical protein